MTRKRINLIVCDRCGHETRPPDGEADGELHARTLRNLQWNGQVHHEGSVLPNSLQDLCVECAESFRKWLRMTD